MGTNTDLRWTVERENITCAPRFCHARMHTRFYSYSQLALLLLVAFFFSCFVVYTVATMSDYKDFQDEFDRVSLGPSLPEDVDVYSSRGARNKDSVNVGSRRMPPPLRSRPHIDFSGQQLSSEVGLGFALPPVPHRPPSHMSGSTLHSSRNHPTASIYSQKQYSSYDLPPDLPPEVLASLMMAQLYQNPLHRQLQEKYEDLCDVLTKYARRDLMEPRIPQSHPTVLDIRQGKLFLTPKIFFAK